MLQRQLSRRERPWMLSFFVDRDTRRRKTGVGKHADRHGDEARRSRELPVNRRAADVAELENGWLAAIAEPRPWRRAAFDRHAVARKTSLHGEHAAGALLAFEAMADGHANGVAFAD